ncbi:MAG: recombinase family protein [Lysobacterales bacterium]
MARIGYARVSTDEQSIDLQVDALTNAGCEQIFLDDGYSAAQRDRPGFSATLKALKAGDTLVIWKMDRAFRSVLHAASTREEFALHGIALQCLTEHIDTSTAMGRCMYNVRNAFAEWERDLISERTIAGMEAARRRGVRIGRPPKLSPAQVAAIKARIDEDPSIAPGHIANEYGVSVRTLGRVLSNLA